MKRISGISICFISIVFFFFLLTTNAHAQGEDFWVTRLHQDWEAQYFKTLDFSTAAIAFDFKGNLYATKINEDWGPGDKNIIRFKAPEYEEQSIFITYETVYDGISGMDFDCIGNLYVSEIMGRNSGSDVGAIRKINTWRHKVSDPIDFTDVGIYGDFRPTGLAATGFGKLYFPGRKWSNTKWGNIYKIKSFRKYDSSTGPMVNKEDAIWTSIALDKWNNLFYSVSDADLNSIPYSIFTINPYTKDEVLIATFNQYVEELSFDSEGNLYVLEGAEEDPSTIIMLKPPYISIDGCDTGIIDWPLSDGSRISDIIEYCADNAGEHEQFVRCVADETLNLLKDGIISKMQIIPILLCSYKQTFHRRVYKK